MRATVLVVLLVTTVLVVLLVTTVLVGGCLDRGTGQDGGAGQSGPGGSPTTTPMAVPSPPVEDPTRPIDGYEAHAACTTDASDCFTFVWIKGNETTTPLEGPEGMPWRGQGAVCDHRNPAMPQFVHDVDVDDRVIRHRDDRNVTAETVLFAFGHFRSAQDCAVVYALVPDPVGRLPVEMGRGGVHTFALDSGAVTVDRMTLPVGRALAFAYDETEAQGDWVVRHETVFEVRNMGLWPASSLVPYDEAAT